MVLVFQVIGIDFGGRFIDTAIKIQRGEEVQFKLSNGDTMLAQVNGNTIMQRAVFKQVLFTVSSIAFLFISRNSWEIIASDNHHLP